jgi:hypothetical protein
MTAGLGCDASIAALAGVAPASAASYGIAVLRIRARS